MSSKKKVVIADDHDMFRAGVKSLLDNTGTIEVIAEACNGKELLERLKLSQPDVVLMDIAMPVMDGIEATKIAVSENPEIKILALSMFGDEEYYFKMVRAGVKGFVLKSSGIGELEKAIHEVANNENYFSNELLRQIIYNISDKKTVAEKKQSDKNSLSSREIEVLKLIASGNSNEEIAEKLNISVTTVKSHRANLLSKSECNNTASLVFYAIKNKYITTE